MSAVRSRRDLSRKNDATMNVSRKWSNLKRSFRKDFERNERLRQGTLRLTIQCAGNLRESGFEDISVGDSSTVDPYVKVEVQRGGARPSHCSTRVLFKTNSPRFNETFNIRCYDFTSATSLCMIVCDRDVSADDILGRAVYHLGKEVVRARGGSRCKGSCSMKLEVDSGSNPPSISSSSSSSSSSSPVPSSDGWINFQWEYVADENAVSTRAREALQSLHRTSVLHSATGAHEAIGKILDEIAGGIDSNTVLGPETIMPILSKVFDALGSAGLKREIPEGDVIALLSLVTGKAEEDLAVLCRGLDGDADGAVTLGEASTFFMNAAAAAAANVGNGNAHRDYWVAPGRSVPVWKGHHGGVHILCPLANGGVAAGLKDGVVQVWNGELNHVQEMQYISTSHAKLQNDLSENTRSGELYAACSDRKIRCWSLSERSLHIECAKSFGLPSVPLAIECVGAKSSVDKDVIVIGTSDGELGIRYTSDLSKKVATLSRHKAAISEIQYSTFHGLLYSSDLDGNLFAADLQRQGNDGRCIAHSSRGIFSFAISSTSHYAAVTDSQRVQLYDISGSGLLSTLGGSGGDIGHRDHVHTVLVVDSRNQLVTASVDRIIKIWDLRMGRALQTYKDVEQDYKLVQVRQMHDGTLVSGGSSIHMMKSVRAEKKQEYLARRAVHPQLLRPGHRSESKKWSGSVVIIVAGGRGAKGAYSACRQRMSLSLRRSRLMVAWAPFQGGATHGSASRPLL